MELTKLTRHSTVTEEEFHVVVIFNYQEIPFRVLKTTSITNSTCFTAVSIKRASNKPNLTKGQKATIREFIQSKLEL